jgi:hypothetical protein
MIDQGNKSGKEESGEKKETKENKEKKRVSPVKLTRKRFKDTEKKEPKRAEQIKGRTSGEIYGLFPTPFGYTSDIVVDVYFKEGIYQYGLKLD